MSTTTTQQPWLGKAWTDIVFILLPPFGCLLFIALFPSLFQNNNNIPDAWWVILILLVDVAHVYSTLYRTYFDKNYLQQERSLLLTIPFVAFIAGVLLYTINDMLFWRLLAYLAVFHFIRQQYGFMRLYSRKEHAPAWCKRIDTFTIYYATIYPLLYWHFTGQKNFNWFVENDFYYLSASNLLTCFKWLYYILLLIYFIKECWLAQATKTINFPRIAVIAGTIASWYFGIVYFNGDMAFTLLNVISHGIPYMALMWLYGKRNYSTSARAGKLLRYVFSTYGILLFLGIIFLLAYIEEGLWDLTLWKEHASLFSIFRQTNVSFSQTWLQFLVPLLALPQITHYVIDGFIWRIKKGEVKV